MNRWVFLFLGILMSGCAAWIDMGSDESGSVEPEQPAIGNSAPAQTGATLKVQGEVVLPESGSN